MVGNPFAGWVNGIAASAAQELGYLSITGPDGFRRNPQNLWDWTECFLDPLEFQGEAKGKRGFDFDHNWEGFCFERFKRIPLD